MIPLTPSDGHAGFISPPSGVLFLDDSDKNNPFFTDLSKKDKQAIKSKPGKPEFTQQKKALQKDTSKKKKKAYKRRERSEEEIARALFDQDEDYESGKGKKFTKVMREIRKRNTKAVKDLKDLYQGRCQLTGEQYTFIKTNGSRYCEAHHLVPLGEAGADSPYNIIIVSPLIHSMFHYAKVSEIDLSQISSSNKLSININDELYEITWHSEHATLVKAKQKK